MFNYIEQHNQVKLTIKYRHLIWKGTKQYRDLLALPGRLDAVAALVDDAVGRVRATGAAGIICWMAKRHPYAAVLRSRGFFDSRRDPHAYIQAQGLSAAERDHLLSPTAHVHLTHGDTDVVFVSEFDDKIAWYENLDGVGSFGSQQVISTLVNAPQSVFAADLDDDGDTDVLSDSLSDNTIIIASHWGYISRSVALWAELMGAVLSHTTISLQGSSSTTTRNP